MGGFFFWPALGIPALDPVCGPGGITLCDPPVQFFFGYLKGFRQTMLEATESSVW
jgi:hypothetical protein